MYRSAHKESNLHYNYFRDYDPSIGRYVQADPIGLKGGWNVYGYVGGNPLSKIDLFGLLEDEPGLSPVCIECLIPALGPLRAIIPALLPTKPAPKQAPTTQCKPSADKHPSTPTGRRGSPLDVSFGTNSPTNIGGRDYTGHSLDRMQGRGVTPSAVEDAIQTGRSSPGNQPGTTVYSGDNGVNVVTGSDGRVITVITR
ncbi:MAG: hypothetical protein KGZ83_08235 [Sulfuricella sp.]|nr:hypothetical protein [Sulfuricella sp.]